MSFNLLWAGGKIGLWGAIMYGIIIPAYRFVESVESLTQLAHRARENIEIRTDEYRAERFEGIFRYVHEKEKQGEQTAIRQFRRHIEDTLGADCHTADNFHYEWPKLEPVGKGKYELRMECAGKTLIAPWGEIELR